MAIVCSILPVNFVGHGSDATETRVEFEYIARDTVTDIEYRETIGVTIGGGLNATQTEVLIRDAVIARLAARSPTVVLPAANCFQYALRRG